MPTSNEVNIRINVDRTDLEATGEEVEELAQNTESKFAGLGAALGVAGAAAGGLFLAGFAKNMELGDATAKLEAQFAVTSEEAKTYGEQAASLYAAGWGENIEEVTLAFGTVSQAMKDVSADSKGTTDEMVQQALTLSKVYGYDVNESIAVVAKMVKNGLAADATEAYDTIAAGARNGIDVNGDLLETLGEYSPQFAKLGLSSQDFLDIMSAGMKAGVRDTDTLADAFKEFSIRSIDGSKLTSEAYSSMSAELGLTQDELREKITEGNDAFAEMGISAEDMQRRIAAGGESARTATIEVLQALASMDDEVKQNDLGTALFGTQWEDTLRTAIDGVAEFEGAAEDASGSLAKAGEVIQESFGEKVERQKRSFEEFTMSLANLPGPLADASASVAAFGGPVMGMVSQLSSLVLLISLTGSGAKIAAAATKAWAVVQGAFNAVLALNPIVLVVIAIAALVAALVLAYKKVDWFREGVDGAMKWVANAFNAAQAKASAALKRIQSAVSTAISFIRRNWMTILGILTLPIGGAVLLIIRYWDRISSTARSMVTKIKSAVSGLPSHMASVGSRMLSSMASAIRNGASRISGAMSDVVSNAVNAAKAKLPGFAHGGIVGAMGGGPRSGLTLVGEHGPELAFLAPGTMVKSNPDTMRMLSNAAGSGGTTSLTIDSSGSRFDELLLEILRKSVRARGGNVQVVLGA